ncbi:hypothetical protein RY27_10990 [Litorilinea aerophila]|nr:hypothetical protein RY27_10990 [Litorilinea aerophila]
MFLGLATCIGKIMDPINLFDCVVGYVLAGKIWANSGQIIYIPLCRACRVARTTASCCSP